MGQSQKWRLNQTDLKKWGRNTLVFLAPVAVIYLGSVSNAIGDQGFQWSDFQINAVVGGAMTLYVINVLLDVFRKLATPPLKLDE